MKSQRNWVFLGLVLFWSGCGDNSQASPPDLVVYGGTVITIDAQYPEASAFSVKDGLVYAVGSDEEILAQANDESRLVNLLGRTVVPGFNDAHLHPVLLPPQAVPLWGAESIDNVVATLRDQISAQGNPWVIGIGYDDTALGRHLEKKDLDRVSTELPVLAIHGSLHLLSVNTQALENADLPAPLVDPEGGKFYRDEQGDPTGLISEIPAAQLLFNERQPSPFVSDPDSALRGLQRFYQRSLSLGITSYSDALVAKDLVRAYLASDPARHGVRVNLMLSGSEMSADEWRDHLDDVAQQHEWDRQGDAWLRANTIKVFHGMSLSGRTARQYEHYHGRPEYFGLEPQRDQAELNALVAGIHDMGFQSAIHSNGDYEVDMVLNAIEAAAGNDDRDHRHRIEHGSIVNESILKRMKDLNVVYAPHSYIYEKGPMIEPYGPRLWPRMFANASSYEYGIPNAANSDYPVSALSPLLRIQSLVTRTSRQGKTYGREQVLSVEQALHAYTMGSAYASFDEQRKGSITPGKFADFVVLSEDPRMVPSGSIKDLYVEKTYVAGELRYDRNPSQQRRSP